MAEMAPLAARRGNGRAAASCRPRGTMGRVARHVGTRHRARRHATPSAASHLIRRSSSGTSRRCASTISRSRARAPTGTTARGSTSSASTGRCSIARPSALDPSGGARDLADALYAELFGLTERDGARRSHFEYFHGRSSLATWLRAVLAQRSVDRARAARRLAPLPDEEPPASPAAVAAPRSADHGRFVALHPRGARGRRRAAWRRAIGCASPATMPRS